jgi:hypothetical protein
MPDDLLLMSLTQENVDMLLQLSQNMVASQGPEEGEAEGRG